MVRNSQQGIFLMMVRIEETEVRLFGGMECDFMLVFSGRMCWNVEEAR